MINYTSSNKLNVILGMVIVLIASFVILSLFFVVAMLSRYVLDFSVVQSIQIMIPMTIAILVSIPLGGILSRIIKPKWLIFVGMIVSALSILVAGPFTFGMSSQSLVWPFILFGLGIGFALGASLIVVLGNINSKDFPIITGILLTIGFVGAILGIIILGLILQFKFNDILIVKKISATFQITKAEAWEWTQFQSQSQNGSYQEQSQQNNIQSSEESDFPKKKNIIPTPKLTPSKKAITPVPANTPVAEVKPSSTPEPGPVAKNDQTEKQEEASENTVLVTRQNLADSLNRIALFAVILSVLGALIALFIRNEPRYDRVIIHREFIRTSPTGTRNIYQTREIKPLDENNQI